MKRAHVLSDREIKQVFAHIDQRVFAERNRAMFQLSIYAGMRVGEIAALRCGDVFTADGRAREHIQLSAAQTKGHKARTVLLNAQVQRELAVYGRSQTTRMAGAPLFVSKAGTAFSPNSLVQAFARIYQRAGVDQATSHAGRHYFLTSLAEKGVSIHVLAALAGHKNISTTMVYLHANANVLRAAVELV
jgi:integrase/recombinase XerD